MKRDPDLETNLAADTVRCWCCGERYPAGTFLRWCAWCVEECTREGCLKPRQLTPDLNDGDA